MKKRYSLLIGFIVFIGMVGFLCLNVCPYYHSATRQDGFQVIHKHDDTIRIGFIGDSWAFLHKRHCCQIASLVSVQTDRPVSVRSVGINGMTSKEIYYSIFNNDSVHSVLDWGPDFCIISAGINDTDLKMGKSFYKNNMHLILQFMTDNDICPVVLEIPYYNIEYSFKRRSRMQKISRLLSMVITGSGMNCIDSYREAFEQLAENTEDPLVYIRCSQWNPEGYQDARGIYTADMMHINDMGYMLLDSCITKEIMKRPWKKE